MSLVDRGFYGGSPMSTFPALKGVDRRGQTGVHQFFAQLPLIGQHKMFGERPVTPSLVTPSLSGVSKSVPQRLKPSRVQTFMARLKPCPSYRVSPHLENVPQGLKPSAAGGFTARLKVVP